MDARPNSLLRNPQHAHVACLQCPRLWLHTLHPLENAQSWGQRHQVEQDVCLAFPPGPAAREDILYPIYKTGLGADTVIASVLVAKSSTWPLSVKAPREA